MTEHTTSYQTAVRARTHPNRFWDFSKRLLDILLGLIGLLLTAPFFALISIIVKLDSPGPVLYRGPRVGKQGRRFRILKFRTMFERPETYEGPGITAQDDPRVTTVGRWLRDTKLNELPQLWNVIRGDMSLVGPRPEDPKIIEDWPVDARKEILSVRPGITSPASVLYRNEEALLSHSKVMSAYLDSVVPSKLRLDQLYVRNRSFWLDLDVLFWTFLLLLLRLGSFQPPEEMLFLGPITRFVRRYLNWFIIDAAVTFSAMGIAGVLWRSFGPLDVGWPTSIAVAFLFALLFSASGALFGVHKIHWSRASSMDALDLFLAALVASGIASLANWYWPGGLYEPEMILMASVLAFIGIAAVRYRRRLLQGLEFRWFQRRGSAVAARERVLLVGGGYAGQFVAWLLTTHRTSAAFQVIGFVDDDLYKQGGRIQGVDVIGQRKDIPQLVVDHDVGTIIFAIHNIDQSDRQRLLEICAQTPARVVMIPDIMGTLNTIAGLHKVVANGEASEQPAPEPAATEELNLTLLGLPPVQVDAWLQRLEASAETGDLDRLMAQLKIYRSFLKRDAEKTANPTFTMAVEQEP